MYSNIEQVEAEIALTPSGNTRFFNTGDLPWIREVENHWSAIRYEVDILLKAIDSLPGFEEVSRSKVSFPAKDIGTYFPSIAMGYPLLKTLFAAHIRSRP